MAACATLKPYPGADSCSWDALLDRVPVLPLFRRSARTRHRTRWRVPCLVSDVLASRIISLLSVCVHTMDVPNSP
eukprot:6188521-Pleurochrysis_carterae.AAC.3